jgi:hypothetical protein
VVTFTATAVGNSVQASVSATASTPPALDVVPDPATAPAIEVPGAVTQLNLPVAPAVTGSQDDDEDDDEDEDEDEGSDDDDD